MWRKQEEHKPVPSPADLVVQPVAEPLRPAPVAPPPPPVTPGGVISKAISIKGEVTGSEDLLVDGEVNGKITIADGKVTVGSSGRVTADIEAAEIVVRGRLKGSLHGRERVVIGQTGQVSGNVITRRIVIEEGAVFSGHVDVVRAEEPRAPRSSMVVTASGPASPVPVHAKDANS